MRSSRIRHLRIIDGRPRGEAGRRCDYGNWRKIPGRNVLASGGTAARISIHERLLGCGFVLLRGPTAIDGNGGPRNLACRIRAQKGDGSAELRRSNERQ